MAETDAAGRHGAPDPWTMGKVLHGYWRAPTIGLVAGLLAYVGSFVLPPTYAAGSRLLVRGQDTTLLSTSGAPLSDSATLLDSQLAGVLSSTNAALLGTNDLATRVVDRLQLDQPQPKPTGMVASSRRFASGLYKQSRAILTYGFYKQPELRQAAIEGVRAGLGAEQVKESYVIEVVATADDPVLAAAIANAAADELVAQSSSRAGAEALSYQSFLAGQVAKAEKEAQSAAATVATFKAAHGLADSAGAQLSAQQIEGLRREVATTGADLAAARARGTELDIQLKATNPEAESSNRIVTGRSETNVDATAPNPAYASILTSSQEAKAEVARLDARLASLQSLLGTERELLATGPTTAIDEQLRELEVSRQLSTKSLGQLSTQYQQALVNAAHLDAELTRLDTAIAPTYPIGPKRYLYLAIGLFVGGLMGFVWSHLRLSRRDRLAQWERNRGGHNDDRIVIDLDAERPPVPLRGYPPPLSPRLPAAVGAPGADNRSFNNGHGPQVTPRQADHG